MVQKQTTIRSFNQKVVSHEFLVKDIIYPSLSCRQFLPDLSVGTSKTSELWNQQTVSDWVERMTFSLNFTAEMIMEEVVRKNPESFGPSLFTCFTSRGLLYLKPVCSFRKRRKYPSLWSWKTESTVFPVWLWILALAVGAYLDRGLHSRL
jgi:hypothetical protein